MGAAMENSVKFTGALNGDYLRGMDPRNNGLLIQIHFDQTSGIGGNIQGPFTLISANNVRGFDDDLAQNLRNRRFESADELLNELNYSGTRLMILYCNSMEVIEYEN